MTDETTPQDSAAMSPASTGSVEPVAWMLDPSRQDEQIGLFWDRDEAVEAAGGKQSHIFPLHRSPTLTEAEREVLLGLACHCDTRSGGEWHRFSAVVRGLLERTKGGGE